MLRTGILLATWLLGSLLAGCASAPSGARAGTIAAPAASSASLDHLPALKGDYFPLASRFSGRVHHIYVRLPEGYDASKAGTYPVVYVLDGDSLFPLLAPTHLFLHYDEKLPEAIIVGIAYGGFDPGVNKRNVDFSAQGADTPAGEGGAQDFLSFLREQLLPEVERRYRADATRRVLLGQSRGGYFVLWSAREDPDLFWARIASNPGSTPAREQLFAAASPHRRDDLRLVVASGSRDTDARMRNAVEWVAYWNARNDVPWEVKHFVIRDGTHAASIGETYRQAMTWLFREEIARAPATP